MLGYIINLFLWDLGSEGIDNRPAKTDWFQRGEVDPNFLYAHCILKITPVGAVTVLRQNM